MRDLHYNYIKGKYGEIAEILLIEYDSLMYKIEPENIFEDFWKEKIYLTLVIIQKIQNITIIQIT